MTELEIFKKCVSLGMTQAGTNSQMMAFYRKGVSLGYWS